MRDLPIIFSAPMIAALLDGRKTMTRRLAWREVTGPLKGGDLIIRTNTGAAVEKVVSHLRPSAWQRVQPGDRLWVRESLATHGHFGFPLSSTPQARGDQRYWSYMADDMPNRTGGRPSIHMPRWASRLTLVVTATKVERLRDITIEDIRAEGITTVIDYHPLHFDAFDGWRKLWADLHGSASWDANPEVVALSFAVRRCNIDDMKEASNG